MSAPPIKPFRDETFEDFEFFNLDEEDFSASSENNSTKTSENDAEKKIGFGASRIFSVLCSIVEDHELTVTVPVKAAATMAAATLTGSLVGGVPGMAAGFIIGTYFYYRKSTGKLKNSNSDSDCSPSEKFTFRQFLNQMTTQQKRDLLRELLKCLKQSSVRLLITEICKNDQIRAMAIQILSEFLFKKMGVKLKKSKPMK